MMKYKDWINKKDNTVSTSSNIKNVSEETDVNITGIVGPDVASLIAKLDNLQAERRKLMKDSQKLEAQLLDIDIKLTKNDIEKIELEEKRIKIKKAIEIANKENREGKIHSEVDENNEEYE